MSTQFLFIPDMMPTYKVIFRNDYTNYINYKTYSFKRNTLSFNNSIMNSLLHSEENQICLPISKDTVLITTKLYNYKRNLLVLNYTTNTIYMFSVENELFFTNACSSFIMDLIFAVITIAFTDEICLNFTTLDYSFIKENTFCLDKHASNDIISSYIVNNLINNDIIKIR